LWGVMLLCVATAIGMGVASYWLGAVLSGIGAIVAGLFVLAQKQAGKPVPTAPIFVGPPLGRGPYDPLDCPPGPQMAENLAKIVEELRIAATTQEWSIEWDRFDSFDRQAKTAVAQKSYHEAVRYYCRAVSFMMAEIRKQRDKQNSYSDSSIDLI